MSAELPGLIVHGHFYQPPRENPWTRIVDREPSARPYHDWNERIYDECYRRNAYARIFADDGRITRIVNNYEAMSFNFGPTLLSWMQQAHPRTFARIVQADRRSAVARDGHGNAIAQGYSHAILPLCNDRDLLTQVRWGIAEFVYRYGREPEALWLPETACNDRVLAVLIEEGMRYVLLAPGQAAMWRKSAEAEWEDVSDSSIDPRRAYRYDHPDGSGRSIALFFYDGAISRAVAFENLLASSRDLVGRFEAASDGAGSLVHVVTDGESYGHHFAGGERCLAYSLFEEARRRGFWVTNYGQWLDAHPPIAEARIKAGDDGLGTAWSCAHGLGRWQRDCGCHIGGKPGWNQRWRGPLRAALDLLRDEAMVVFEDRMGSIAGDPWALRDAYIELLLDVEADRGAFFERHLGRRLGEREQSSALALLEMQRSSMLMYTSCGWFFDDLAGLETVQILRYAGCLLDQLEGSEALRIRSRFLEALAEAESNVPACGSGADVFRRRVDSARVTKAAIAAHVGIGCLAGDSAAAGQVAGRRYELFDLERRQHGRLALATGRVALRSIVTGAEREYGLAALKFGGIDVYCMLRQFDDEAAFARSARHLWQHFDGASLLTILRIAEEEFGPEEYGLRHVLPGGRDAIARSILADALRRYTEQYDRLYEDNRRLITQFQAADLPLPEELRVAAELTLSRRLDAELERQRGRSDAASYRRAVEIADEARRFDFELRFARGQAHFAAMIEGVVQRVAEPEPEANAGELVHSALELLELVDELGFEVDFSRAQETLYRAVHRGLALSEPVRELAYGLGLSERALGLEPAAAPALQGPGARR
ncbi:MAG: DUF3536 domain-containing protein [Deltaproteobacteria bacterium]|jgi:hypothetical protein|nr:DUF3536 domain-containing protein [Deltaproteobacteria bacterium]MBW2532694.1 DUF3536 domain-containing protein [Deltaproteobacteria bacterium]